MVQIVKRLKLKAEHNAKQKTKYFVFIVEAHPIFATQWQIVKAEHNAKQKDKAVNGTDSEAFKTEVIN